MPFQENRLILARCPRCNVADPHLFRKDGPYTTEDSEGRNERYWANYVCQSCGGVVLTLSRTQNGEIIEILPSTDVLDEAIPDRVKEYLKQAIESKHAPVGSIITAASAVDAMLKAKGYADGDLYSRINKATEDHLITEGMNTWANEVRLDANAQRHADESEPLPKTKDAERCIEFSKALALFLFILPSRVTRGIEDATGTGDPEEESSPKRQSGGIGFIPAR